MSYQHWRSLHLTCRMCHVRNIFIQGRPAQSFPSLTVTMTTQTQSMGYIPVLGEIRQEVLCPTPRGMRHTMHEQNWRETHMGYGVFFYNFQFHSCN